MPEDDGIERTERCPRPVEEAFDAATSVLDLVISNAVDNWLDYVFQRQSRQYTAAYCLSAASAIIEMGELLPVGEPEALSRRLHRETTQSQHVRPLSARMPGGAARPPQNPHTHSVPMPPSVPWGKPSPWPSPRASPRPPPDNFYAAPIGSQRALAYPLDVGSVAELRKQDALPFWGYVSEEAVPAPIDSMARGVVPIRVKPTGDMTDSMLLIPGGKIPTAGVGTGKNLKKPPASATSRASSKTPGSSYITTHDRKMAEATAALAGPSGGKIAAGRLRPASAPAIRASAMAGLAAGTRVGGLSDGSGAAADGNQVHDDEFHEQPLKTYRSAQGAGAASARPSLKRRPASAAARSPLTLGPVAAVGGNVLESQAVVLLFQSRRTLIRGLFDHYLSAGGVSGAPSGGGGAGKLPLKLVSLDEAFR